MKVSHKIVGGTVLIDAQASDGDSSETLACATVTDATGRQARAWLSVRIKPNGKAEFAVNVLGKSKSGDRWRALTAGWHEAGELA